MREAELAIVGAGAAGLSTAAAAAAHGVKVTIFDDNALPGGQFFRQLPPGFRRTVTTKLNKDIARGNDFYEVVRHPEVTYLADTVVWDMPENGVLAYAREQESGQLRAQLIVIAAGAYDRPLPFPGWTLPGVVTAGGVQNLIKGQGVIPGRRAVVAGNGPLVLLASANVVRGGAELVEVVEAAPLGRRLWRCLPDLLSVPKVVQQAIAYRAVILRAGVPFRTGWTVIEAQGDRRCEEVVIAPIDGAGEVNRAASRTVAADLLVVGFGLVPSTELLRICGVDMQWNAVRGGWLPCRSPEFETSRPGVFAVGDGSAIGGVEIALVEGRLMGLVAANRLGRLAGVAAQRQKHLAIKQLARLDRFRRGLERLYAPPATYLNLLTPETIICRCEEVAAGDLNRRQHEGYASISALKFSTRSSMGRCQGRNCLRTLIDIVAANANLKAEEVVLPRARPPARPVLLGDLLHETLRSVDLPDHGTAHLPRGEKVG